MRTRLRRFDTAAGVVRIRLANVGCRSCGRVFAPLLLMLDLTGKRRTDRLSVELAELATQMSFARAGSLARRFGLPGSSGRAHHATADVAPLLAVGQPDTGGPTRADVVVLDGTGMRASARRLGVTCNIALGITGREGPRRRRHAHTVLLGMTLAREWASLGDQLRALDPPVMVVADGEEGPTVLAETIWPEVPIQRCWWHLCRGLRWALYADKADHRWANAKRDELRDLLCHAAGNQLTPTQALQPYDALRGELRDLGHTRALSLLDVAREQVFVCLRADIQQRLAHLGGPEMGSGVLERVMRELNARTDIGGSRWSVDGLRDLLTVKLAAMTEHPAWARLRRTTHPANAIDFTVKTVKFNAG